MVSSLDLGLCPGLCPTPPTLSPVSKQDLLAPQHTPNMQIQWCLWPCVCGFLTSSPKSLYSTAGPPNPAPSSLHSQGFPQSL